MSVDPRFDLKLPLTISPVASMLDIRDADGMLKATWWGRGEDAKHRAEVIVAALEADAERQGRAESGEKQCTCLTNQLGPDYCPVCQA